MTERPVDTVIHVKGAYKYYGAFQVLGGINMSVERGTIYGLLGPSGCGKTTLMNCIVGNTHIDSGSIQFGFTEHKDLGFMPQDISLHWYLTIRETMIFYGYMFSMDSEAIKRRVKYLCEMLDLPPLSRVIASLSGGQQRRVSLAVALLHDPKVLILDEPTVGLDPVLSTAIWDRLQEMSRTGKTIIVTTHYIEEARQADMIGLMRKGRMLMEDSPSALLQRYNAEYLEDVFLVLCAQDNEASKNVNQAPPVEYCKSTTFESSKKISFSKVKALIWKNLCLAKNNFLMSLFIILLPITLYSCVHFSYGHNPFNIPIGVINKEFQNSLQRCPRSYSNNCILADEDHWASCAFISGLRDKTYKVTEYTDFERAKADYDSKRIFVLLTFSSNYTKALGERVIEGTEVSNPVIDASTITALIDKNDHIVYLQYMVDLVKEIEALFQNSLETCDGVVSPRTLRPTIRLEAPVHGSFDTEIVVHFVMAFNIINILFCPMIYACALILDEKDQGVIDRILCCGTTMKEIMISHMTLQTCMLVLQVVELFILTYHIFGQPLMGNPCLMLVLLVITAFTGVLIGTAIGLVTEHLMIAVNLGVAGNFLIAFSSGLFWPLQGAHPSIRDVMPFVPLTGTMRASREISLKGHGLEHPQVVGGFVSSISWCIGSSVILLLIINNWKGPWNTKQ